MSNINVSRKFDSLVSAIQILESEGKLDLSYNRPLALSDAKFLERSPRASLKLVFADEAGQLWYLLNHEGENILHKYRPFGTLISSGPLKVYGIAPDFASFVDLGTSIPNTGLARRMVRLDNLCICSD